MTEKRKTIRIEVTGNWERDLKSFVRSMDGAEQAVGRFGRAGTGAGGFRQMASDIFYMGNAAMMAYRSVAQIAGTANDFAQLGYQTEKSKLALTQLAGSAGEAERWIRALQEGMRGTATEGEAASLAYRLMRFNLADSAEEAQKFARVLAIISAANPQLGGTAEAISQIQLTLSNQSFMRLDQLGVSAGEVRKRIEELKKSTQGLGNEEAFQMAVMEQLTEQANTIGDGILKVDEKYQQLGARTRELKEDLGVLAAEGFEVIADTILDAWTAADQLYKIFGLLTGKDWKVALSVVLGTGDNRHRYTAQDFQQGNPNLPTYEAIMGQDVFTTSGPVGPELLAVMKKARESQSARYAEMIYAMWDTAQATMSERDWVLKYTPRSNNALTARLGAFNQSHYMNIGTRFDNLGRMWMPQYAGDYVYGYAPQQMYGAPGTMYTPQPNIHARGRTGWAYEVGKQIGPIVDQFQQWQSQGFTRPGGTGLMGAVNQAIDSGSLEKSAAAMERMTEAAQSMGRTFESLADMLGTGQTGFAADVEKAMVDAMEKAHVSTTAQNEALEIYGHLTNDANAASEVFGNKLDWLSQLYASGKIDVFQYMQELQKLQSVDLSGLDWISKAFGQMGPTQANWEYYKGVLDYLSQLDMQGIAAAMAAPQTALGMAQTVAGAVSNWLTGGTGEEGADPASQWANQMAEMDGSTKEFSDKAAGHFQTLADSGVDAAATIQSAFSSLHIDPISTTVTATISSGGTGSGGGAGVPGRRRGGAEFASGGYTGDGGAGEIAGVVHRGEYVIPRGRIPVMPPFARSGGVNQPVQLVLDGRVIYETVIKQSRGQPGAA